MQRWNRGKIERDSGMERTKMLLHSRMQGAKYTLRLISPDRAGPKVSLLSSEHCTPRTACNIFMSISVQYGIMQVSR